MKKTTTNENRVSVELVKEIEVNDLNTGKPCRICIEKFLSGKDEWLPKKYNLCVTYNAADSKGKHYSLVLGWDFMNLSKEAQIFLVDTEIAHIARGHMTSGKLWDNYSKYLRNDATFNKAADLYVVYKGHQTYTKDLIDRIFSELDTIPMSKKDKKAYAMRRLHMYKIIECLEKRNNNK